jgi:UDP-glucose 4-epimerase
VPDGARLVERTCAQGLGDVFADSRRSVLHLAAQVDVRVSVERPTHERVRERARHARGARGRAGRETQVVFSSTGGRSTARCDGPASEDAERRRSRLRRLKLAGEEYLAAYNRLYGMRHVSLRYGNVYGPRQDPHGEAGVVAIFLGSLAEGRAPRIFGDGLQTRDYVYAGDVARATLAAGGQDGGVFNVGTGSETSVVELYEACRRVAGSALEAEHAPERLGELQRSVLDVSRSERELGWRPEVPLEEGVRLTWESISA